MARPKRADWLDQIILEAKPAETPKADFDAWRNAYAGAIQRLRQRGARIPRVSSFAKVLQLARDTTRNPLTRLTVAAAIIAGVLILVTSPMSREPVEPARTVTDQPARSTPESTDPAERELRLANELFLRGDVQGLLSLLDTGLPRTVFAVAGYLGRIGDTSSLPTLQTLAAQWQGPAEENPFQEAIGQIRQRHGQDDAKPAGPPQDRVVGIPLAGEPAASDKEGQTQTCRGAVVNKAGIPVNGATVWAQNCTKDLKLTDIATSVRTDSQGWFRLTVPVGDSAEDNRTYLLCKHAGYALGWMRLPADPEPDGLDDCRIVLYEPTVVAGTVADVYGRSIPGALVEARVVAKHDPTSAREYLYVAGNERAVRTNSSGQFVLEDVPEGGLLSLSVSRQGYASCDSREGYGSLLGTSPYIDPESYTVRAGRRDVKIELISARGRIDGRIVDERGAPCEGAVVVRCEDSNRMLAKSGYSYSNGRCIPLDVSQRGVCSVDDRGRFRIEDLPVGEYVVAAVDPASGNVITPLVRTAISKTRPRSDVTLRVGTMVDVRVRVRSQTGEPLGDVLLFDVAMTHGYTDPNGLCVLHLVRGNHPIRNCGWGKSTEPTVRESFNPAGPPVDIVVEALPELRGRLIDKSGAPVRGWVRPFARARALTDAEGRFVLARQWENEMYFARNTEGTLARVCFCVGMVPVGGTELEIRLEPLAVFTGRVLDYDGTPIDDACVTFHLWADRPDPLNDDFTYAGTLRCRVFLFDGRFHLEVPVGLRLTLAVSRDGYEGKSEPVNPASGQTYDLGDILLQPSPDPSQ